jgi:competence protein ComEA
MRGRIMRWQSSWEESGERRQGDVPKENQAKYANALRSFVLPCRFFCQRSVMRTSFIAIAALFAFAGTAQAAVNINTATQAELQTLHGINAAKAKAIIDYRTKAGAFRSTDDLEKVDGISPQTVDLHELRKDISLTGPTVLKKDNKPAAK